jgi:hypothetical protein
LSWSVFPGLANATGSAGVIATGVHAGVGDGDFVGVGVGVCDIVLLGVGGGGGDGVGGDPRQIATLSIENGTGVG